MSIIFKLPKDIPTTVSIIKVNCEGKFYIAKVSNIDWFEKELQKTYGKYIRIGIPESNLYYPLIKHLYKQDRPKVSIEVLYTSDNGYKLLKFELEQLQEHFGKKDCLNLNNIPYIPKTVVAKTGSNWLTQNQALNFRKLLTKYDY